MSRRRQRHRHPARRTGTRVPRRRILVLCEGKVTEPTYIEGFRRWCRNPLVHVEIPDDRGVPRTLVQLAKEYKDSALRRAETEGDEYLAFDETWCVFDVDEHPHLANARQMARDNGIRVALSNPCFELWLLLHFRESPGARGRRDLVAQLRRFLPSYDKHVGFRELAGGYEEAKRRAERLQRHADEDGEPMRNPTTGVYRLTSSIEEDDRRHAR